MNLSDFHWLSGGEVREENGGLVLTAPPMTDYFRDPEEKNTRQNAPFLCTEVSGDFVLRARVRHGFLATYDACCLMVLVSDAVWAKACFEYTDYGTHAAVSVVTNGVSDDANHSDIHQDSLWLQLVRRGNAFGAHYSLDGKTWFMTRCFSLPAGGTVLTGLVAQSPAGNGGRMEFYDVSLEHRTLQNLRAGV